LRAVLRQRRPGQASRTGAFQRQIKGSLVFKVLALAASFVLTPVAIHYVGEGRFGVWVTMNAILSWIVFFDLGLGHGLRNRLTEALALRRRDLAAHLIGTAYAAVGLIAAAGLLLLTVGAFFIEWQRVFNTVEIPETELRTGVLILGFFVASNFVLSLVNQLFHARQQTSITVLWQLLSNGLALAFVFGVSRWLPASLVALAAAYGLGLLMASIVLSFWFFAKNRDLVPSLDRFRLSDARDLTSLGVQFFTIQLAVLVLFTIDRIIITQLFGPAPVAGYEVVMKLFSLVLVGTAIVLAPLWSSFAKAFAEQDIDWVAGMLRKANLLPLAAVPVCLGLVVAGPELVRVWIGRELATPMSLFVAVAGLVVVRVWCDVYAHFLNAANAMRVQMYAAAVQATVNIPLSIVLGQRFGVSGVVYATTISLLLSAVALPVHTLYVLRSRRVAS
jgi:O-antigen/teichoic acid export membrane protein